MTQQIKISKRAISGILLLDKALGVSSNRALQQVKRLFNAKKAGHTGSLDPLASGMLPICLGEATKLSQYLLTADKTYEVEARLGVRTETGDAEGEVVAEKEVLPYALQQLDQVFDNFRGDIKQVPSMYSALKYQGQPLYKLARQGITVERPARDIKIYQLCLLDYAEGVVRFSLRCSKGTYVRTLVDDFGQALGCGAHVTGLRRTQVGEFSSTQMYTLEALQQVFEEENFSGLDRLLLPLEIAVSHLPQFSITESMAFYFKKGQPILVPQTPTAGEVILKTKSGQLIGVGEISDAGLVAPRRLLK